MNLDDIAVLKPSQKNENRETTLKQIISEAIEVNGG